MKLRLFITIMVIFIMSLGATILQAAPLAQSPAMLKKTVKNVALPEQKMPPQFIITTPPMVVSGPGMLPATLTTPTLSFVGLDRIPAILTTPVLSVTGSGALPTQLTTPTLVVMGSGPLPATLTTAPLVFSGSVKPPLKKVLTR